MEVAQFLSQQFRGSRRGVYETKIRGESTSAKWFTDACREWENGERFAGVSQLRFARMDRACVLFRKEGRNSEIPGLRRGGSPGSVY